MIRMMATANTMQTTELGADSVHLLLVEDCPEYAALVQRWLEQGAGDTKFTINWSRSLKGALAELEEDNADLVLLDLGLPDSDGLDTFVSVRAMASDLPTVVLSGGENHALALRAIELGAQEYIVKSTCNADLLGRILRHAVARHRMQKARMRKLLGLAGSVQGQAPHWGNN
jgi:DNA-binding response OmpR family regulator